jgi:hypothetical protein
MERRYFFFVAVFFAVVFFAEPQELLFDLQAISVLLVVRYAFNVS